MKILHVIQTLSPRYGGPSINLRGLAHEQARVGHQVFICTTYDHDHAWNGNVTLNGPIKENEITVWCHKAYFGPLLLSGELALCLKRVIAGFDIVHIHGLYRFPVSYAAWSARKKGVPYIITPHGSLDPFLYRQSRYGRAALPLKRIYEQFFDIPNLNNATAIHYTAQEEAERTSFLKLRAKAVIVPNGLDWESYKNLPAKGFFRKHLGLTAKTPLILFLGRINFKKGLDLLVPAFVQVLRKLPQARLAIVGPDNEGYGSRVRHWCRERRIEEKVVFVGHLEREDVKRAYVDADVFVLPSYAENFGMTIVEAMACGCPVIISDQVNIWREVMDAGAGIVVKLDPGQIANAICYVLENNGEAQIMGTKGRWAAQGRYAWPHIIEKLTRIYEELIEEAAAKRHLGR
jgi:glycosyltransferase involved in cell wall biosynthesis